MKNVANVRKGNAACKALSSKILVFYRLAEVVPFLSDLTFGETHAELVPLVFRSNIPLIEFPRRTPTSSFVAVSHGFSLDAHP